MNRVCAGESPEARLDAEPGLSAAIQTVQGVLCLQMIMSRQNYTVLSLKLLGQSNVKRSVGFQIVNSSNLA